MDGLHYYARKQYVKNGTTGNNDRFGTKQEMEYQYYLYCANSAQNNDGNSLARVEWGTIEHGKIEDHTWVYAEPEPEPEPEE